DQYASLRSDLARRAGAVENVHVDTLGLWFADIRGGVLLGEQLSEGAGDPLGPLAVDIVSVDLNEALVDDRFSANHSKQSLRSEIESLGLVDLAGKIGRLD